MQPLARHDLEPVVNLDILLHIMSYVARDMDLLNMMSTCKTLHSFGLPMFLSRSFTIREGLSSVIPYVLRDKETRGEMLRQLAIESFPNDMEPLVEILTSAHNLRRLTIFECELFFSFPDLEQAITGFTSIQHLTLAPAGPQTLRALAKIRSPIAILELSSNREDHLDFLPFIPSFAQTLCQVSGMRFSPDIRLPSSLRYPNVRYLQLTLSRSSELSTLESMFPNLRTLCIYPLYQMSTAWQQRELPVAEWLLKDHPSGEVPRQSWGSLATIEGEVSLISLAKLNRPIRTVLCDMEFHGDEEYGRDILRTLKPQYFGLRTPHEASLIRHVISAAYSVTHLCLIAESVWNIAEIRGFLVGLQSVSVSHSLTI
ncbi:hypothetical protein K474DRAFT_463709 [Panus rudis PR-1116 ss-1]|nr:hypothetical protein K474DRAFT_463709 [Panus rudis PR-1116 ss-1]